MWTGPAWPASECSAAGSRAEDLTAGGARVVFEDTRELDRAHRRTTRSPNSFDCECFNRVGRGHAVVTDTNVNKERSWTTSSGSSSPSWWRYLLLAAVVLIARQSRTKRRRVEAERIREQVREETVKVERREALADETAARARAAKAEAEAKAAEDSPARGAGSSSSERHHVVPRGAQQAVGARRQSRPRSTQDQRQRHRTDGRRIRSDDGSWRNYLDAAGSHLTRSLERQCDSDRRRRRDRRWTSRSMTSGGSSTTPTAPPPSGRKPAFELFAAHFVSHVRVYCDYVRGRR